MLGVQIMPVEDALVMEDSVAEVADFLPSVSEGFGVLLFLRCMVERGISDVLRDP